MTSPKIGAPEVFLLATAVTSTFAGATYSHWTRSSRSKADVISILRKAVSLTASLMLISSPAFAARPHQTRAGDLAMPTYERQLIPLAITTPILTSVCGFRVIRNRLDSDAGVLTGTSG
jgi:hypothetical protein